MQARESRMSAQLLAPIPADVFKNRPWVRSGAVVRAVADAIKAGPRVSQRIQAEDKKHLRYIQKCFHQYADRRGYRVQTASDLETLTLYGRVIGKKRKSPMSDLAAKALANELKLQSQGGNKCSNQQ
jgi:hypothetical protein